MKLITALFWLAAAITTIIVAFNTDLNPLWGFVAVFACGFGFGVNLHEFALQCGRKENVSP